MNPIITALGVIIVAMAIAMTVILITVDKSKKKHARKIAELHERIEDGDSQLVAEVDRLGELNASLTVTNGELLSEIQSASRKISTIVGENDSIDIENNTLDDELGALDTHLESLTPPPPPPPPPPSKKSNNGLVIALSILVPVVVILAVVALRPKSSSLPPPRRKNGYSELYSDDLDDIASRRLSAFLSKRGYVSSTNIDDIPE